MFLMKRSLFAKILLGMLFTTTVPFMLSSYFSYQIIGQSIKDQMVELNQNSMNITMSSIHKYIHDLSTLAISYYSDQQLMRYLEKEEMQSLAETLYINSSIERIFAGYTEVRLVTFKSARTNKQFDIKSDINERQLIIPDFERNQLTFMREELEQEYSVIQVNNERRLRINKFLIDIPTRDVLGLTTLAVKDNVLKRLTDPLSDSEGGAVYILLQDDLQLLYATTAASKDTAWMDRMKKEMTGEEGVTKGFISDSEGMYIFYKDESYQLPITLVKFIPQAVIAQAANEALNKSITIHMVVIVFVTIMAGFISYFVLFRVKRILHHIKNVKMGDFNIKVRSKGTDELGILEERFQEMIMELDVLWNQQYRSRMEISTARLKMLQAQINPHFLFNTLQSIGTLAIKKNATEVSDKLAELGAMFRYTMDIDTESVPLREELAHVDNYMSLQIGRFSTRLKYTLSCPEEALDVLVPKMILQPFVENSIVHGFEKGNGTGKVSIEITVGEKMHIKVSDTGQGFDGETVREIKWSYGSEPRIHKPSYAGIGIINVLKRLQLYYGEGFNWDIISVPYEETAVSLWLPLLEKREVDPIEDTDRG